MFNAIAEKHGSPAAYWTVRDALSRKRIAVMRAARFQNIF